MKMRIRRRCCIRRDTFSQWTLERQTHYKRVVNPKPPRASRKEGEMGFHESIMIESNYRKELTLARRYKARWGLAVRGVNR